MMLALRILAIAGGLLLVVMALVVMDAESRPQAPIAGSPLHVPPKKLPKPEPAVVQKQPAKPVDRHAESLAALRHYIESLDADDRFAAYQALQLYRDSAALFAGDRLNADTLPGLLRRHEPPNEPIRHVAEVAPHAVFNIKRNGQPITLKRMQDALWHASPQLWIKRATRTVPKTKRQNGEPLDTKIESLIKAVFVPVDGR